MNSDAMIYSNNKKTFINLSEPDPYACVKYTHHAQFQAFISKSRINSQ